MADIIWDHRPLYVYKQTSEEMYKIIEKRYADFVDAVTDLSKEPVTVFDPLRPELLEELELIREASRELQAKKDEDIRKSQAAEAEPKVEEETKESEEQTEE